MVSLPTPTSTLDRVRREIERNALRARNGISLVRGTAGPKGGATPKETVWRHGRAQLWRYRNDDVRFAPPLILVSSLVSRSYVLDLAPGNSFIEQLLNAGFDVYMFDWGEPDERDAGNLLEDYVDGYMPDGLRRVQELTQSDTVNLFGYCFGGMLALLHAAHDTRSPINSLSVMATPIDFSQLGPSGDIFGKTSLDVENLLDTTGNIPAHVMLQSFQRLQPVAEVTKYVNLLEKLHSEEYVASYALMGGWATDHVPFPGGVARQMVEMIIRNNGFIEDRITLNGDRVSLRDITLPLLSITASRDHIVPPPAAEPLLDLVGSTDKEALRLDAGHVGVLVGRSAARTNIPRIIEFLHKRSEAVS